MADQAGLSAPAPDLLHALRAATKAAHRSLDHHPLLAALVRPGLDVLAYGRALAALHGPQKALELALVDFAPAWAFPSRWPALEEDLLALGVLPPPLRMLPPPVAGVGQWMGLCYVLEGSRLGAALIAANLESALPPEVPRRYFSGADGRAYWPRFQALVGARSDPAEHEVAVAAAVAAFGLYKAHLDDCLRSD